ncbi:MAG: secretin N-terminal domain-containing protein [Candidatus Zipacnadales bacterium]
MSVFAQSRPYYNITEISARRSRNAVIVTIKADGAMTEVHSHDFLLLSEGEPKPVDVVELHCSSGKSQVGDFVDISMYPVSHVELEPRTWSNDGIGLTLRIKLYTPARVRHFHSARFNGDWEWEPSQGCCFDGETGPDKQSFVVTVVSDRFPEAETEATEPAEQELFLEPSPEGTYNLHTVNADLDRVAHELGREAGARILVDESVKRHVTAHLPEMTVEELLQSIAKGYGLALEQKDGQYILSKGLPANVATYETNVTQVVKLDYLSAEDALDLLPNFLLAYISPSEAQNALIVAGPQQLADRVRSDVAKIDHPPPQIRVQVAAVKVARDQASQKSLLAEFTHGTSAFDLDPGRGGISYDYFPEPTTEVRARLRRLQQRGIVETLARAQGILLNGRYGRLFLGQQRYVQVTRNTAYGDEQIAVPVNLGVELRLMAWTGGEDIALWLRPIVTTLGGVDPMSNLPIVDRYETHGSLIVRNGETVLLGGIRLQIDHRVADQVAWLGGLGLPQNRRRLMEDAEIALFITAESWGESSSAQPMEFRGRLARDLKAAGVEWNFQELKEPLAAEVPSTEAVENRDYRGRVQP